MHFFFSPLIGASPRGVIHAPEALFPLQKRFAFAQVSQFFKFLLNKIQVAFFHHAVPAFAQSVYIGQQFFIRLIIRSNGVLGHIYGFAVGVVQFHARAVFQSVNGLTGQSAFYQLAGGGIAFGGFFVGFHRGVFHIPVFHQPIGGLVAHAGGFIVNAGVFISFFINTPGISVLGSITAQIGQQMPLRQCRGGFL